MYSANVGTTLTTFTANRSRSLAKCACWNAPLCLQRTWCRWRTPSHSDVCSSASSKGAQWRPGRWRWGAENPQWCQLSQQLCSELRSKYEKGEIIHSEAPWKKMTKLRIHFCYILMYRGSYHSCLFVCLFVFHTAHSRLQCFYWKSFSWGNGLHLHSASGRLDKTLPETLSFTLQSARLMFLICS